MKAVKIKGATRILGAPKDWNRELDGPCDALYVRDGLLNGSSCAVSAWKPNDQELAVLNSGGCVELYVCSNFHPPVAIGVNLRAEE